MDNNSNYNQIGGEPVNIIMEQKNVIGIDDTYDTYSNNEPPKKKGRLFYMIIGIVAGLVLFGFIIYFNVILDREPKPSGEPTSAEKLKAEEKKLNDNYQVIDTKLTDTDVLLEIKNNNDTVVQSTLRVELYDSNKQVIDKLEFEPIIISSKSSSYETFSYDSSLGVTSYKAFTKLSKQKYKIDKTDDVEVTSSSRDNNKINFNYANNSDDNLNYVSCGVFFYDSNHKMIGYTTYVSNEDFEAYASTSGKVSIPSSIPLNSSNSWTFEVKVLTGLQIDE